MKSFCQNCLLNDTIPALTSWRTDFSLALLFVINITDSKDYDIIQGILMETSEQHPPRQARSPSSHMPAQNVQRQIRH